MATDSAIPLTLGVIALIGMPGVIAAVICADEVVESVKHKAERVHQAWHDQRAIDRMERAIAPAPPAGPPWATAARVASEVLASARDSVAARLNAAGLAPDWLPAPVGPAPLTPFEEVVAELRALPRAHADYDQALATVCRYLSIPEHLSEVDGLDLEIERLRVEGTLTDAGIQLGRK